MTVKNTKPKKTGELPLGKEGKGKLKAIDGSRDLFGTPSKKIRQLAAVHRDSLERTEDAKTFSNESKGALHKELEKLRKVGKLAWVRTQSERRSYKFEATASFTLKTEKQDS